MATKLSRSELEEKIAARLQKEKYGVLSTVEEDKPRSRYMAVFHDGLTVLMLADRRSYKVDQLEKNAHANLLLGFEGHLWPKDLVDVQGKASVSSDRSIVHELWEKDMNRYWEGPDDPNIVVLKLEPDTIVLTEGHNDESVWHRDGSGA
ncbi:pyridoxamine 5'-phosphate oxidase family protein [Paenibacillus pasadenensis]|uniref:pyridoxamine 5'-phosphate oxidase family protein n=1 Tax=Paenibacillus pasadenensis TaxID=217090 RepID=UPI00203E17FC|nr:pyridoxamine 5'-phosphate oxidase family protein [Paenibacillus pasadenensis]MCM3748379.1 pyridoxamine 5'-phosphate oxidase family protein [Paenibacillus pasadenensis]